MVEMRVSWCCALIATAMLAIGPACGGDDDDDSAGTSGGSSGKGGSTAGTTAAGQGGDSGSNDVMPGTICARVATILCEGEAKCCTDPGREVSACKTSVMKTCSNTYMLDTIAADDRVGFDADGASMAVAMLDARAKKCDPSVAAWAGSSEGFSLSLNGTLGEGEDCEPKGGADNASVAELLTSLASCKLSDKLACMPGAMGWKCAARSAAGGKCGTDANCNDGLYCDNPSGELDGNGTCMTRKAAAAACTDNSQCASFVCASGKCAASDDVQAAYCFN